jgi:hypothetical protein
MNGAAASSVRHTRWTFALPVADSLLRGRRFFLSSSGAALSASTLEDSVDYTDVRNISVRLHWDSWKSAHVALDDLQDAHWQQPPGAPRELLHAYVACDRIPAGVLPHDCTPTDAPHQLLVCILKGQTPATVYAELECRAALRAFSTGTRPGGQTMMPLRTA